MRHLIARSILCSSATCSALASVPITVDSMLNPSVITPAPQSPTAASGAVTVTVIPTQVVLGDATLTRNTPGIFVASTLVSLGSTALVLGTSTIPFATSGLEPIYTVAGQTVADVLHSSWTSLENLILDSPCDAPPLMMVNAFLGRFTSLLKEIGCNSLYYPSIALPSWNRSETAFAAIRQLREKEILDDVRFEAA